MCPVPAVDGSSIMLYGDVLSGYLASNLPDLVLELIFSYLSLRDIMQCMTVCQHWHRYLSDENNDIWRTHCLQKLSEDCKQIN